MLRIRGFPCGNQLYLFINHMHGTTALIDAIRGSFHIQTPTWVFAELIWPKPAPAYLLNSYVLHCNSSLCSTEAALCSVKRQGLKFLLRFLTIKELMHNIRAQTSQPKPAKLHCSGCHSPHLRAACEQNLSKSKKGKKRKWGRKDSRQQWGNRTGSVWIIKQAVLLIMMALPQFINTEKWDEGCLEKWNCTLLFIDSVSYFCPYSVNNS